MALRLMRLSRDFLFVVPPATFRFHTHHHIAERDPNCLTILLPSTPGHSMQRWQACWYLFCSWKYYLPSCHLAGFLGFGLHLFQPDRFGSSPLPYFAGVCRISVPERCRFTELTSIRCSCRRSELGKIMSGQPQVFDDCSYLLQAFLFGPAQQFLYSLVSCRFGPLCFFQFVHDAHVYSLCVGF